MADENKVLEEAMEARRCLGVWFNERPMRPFDHKALVRELMAGFDALLAAGVMASQPWEVKVHCSKGERTLRAGMRWRDGLHGSTWVVIEPEGGSIYSPSGLGGTPTFWCLPAGVLPEAAKHLLDGARADGGVSFCGDSIAAGLIGTAGVDLPDGAKNG